MLCVEALGVQFSDALPDEGMFRESSLPFRPLLSFRVPRPSGRRWKSRQLEHQLEGVVHGAQLVVCQMADPFSESTRVDRPNHLAKHLRWLVENVDLWVEACLESGARRRADDYGRERQEVVRLDDHRVAPTMLDMPALSGELDLVDVTTDHAGSP